MSETSSGNSASSSKSPPLAGRSRVRFISTWAVSLIGLAVSCALFWGFFKSGEERRAQIFNESVLPLVQRLPERFEEHLLILDSINRFFLGSDTVERDEFKEFVGPLLTANRELLSLCWNPVVSWDARPRIEELAQKDGFSQFSFVERDAKGGLVPAGRRELYFPTLYLEPQAGNLALLGLDFYTDPELKAAMDRACEQGLPSFIPKRTLFKEGSEAGRCAAIVFYPVFKKGQPASSPEERRKALSGFILAKIDIGALVEGLSEGLFIRNAHIDLNDLDAAQQDGLLFSSREKAAFDSGFKAERAFDFCGRRLYVSCRPSAAFFDANPMLVPWLVLALSLLASAALAFSFSYRDFQLEFLVGLLRREKDISELRDAVSIRWRIVGAVFFAIVMLLAWFIFWLKSDFLSNGRVLVDEMSAHAGAFLHNMIEEEMAEMRSVSKAILSDSKLLSAWGRRDAAAIRDALRSLEGSGLSGLSALSVSFLGSDRRCLVSSNAERREGDLIDLRMLSYLVRNGGESCGGLDLDPDAALELRFVEAASIDGSHLGFLVVERRAEPLFELLRGSSGGELFVVVSKELLSKEAWQRRFNSPSASEWDDYGELLPLRHDIGGMAKGLLSRILSLRSGPGSEGLRSIPDIPFETKRWACGVIPLKDFSGRCLGGVLALRDSTSVFQSHRSVFHFAILGAGAFALLLLFGIFSMASSMERRLLSSVLARERKEDALYETQEQLSSTLHSIGDAVISTDVEGRVADMNAVAEKLTGWSLQEARGQAIKNIFNIVSSATRLPAEIPVEKVIRSGMVVGLANHTVLIAKSGSETQISDSAAPIRSASGAIIGTVLVFRDVTEDYRMREALRSSEEKFRLLSDNARDLICLMELPSGVYKYISPSVKELTGYEPDDFYRTPGFIKSIIHPDYMEKFQEQWKDYLDGGIPPCSEYEILHKDGSPRWLYQRNSPLYGPDGKVCACQGIASDVTDAKRSAEALARSEERFRSLFDNMAEGVALHKLVFDAKGEPVDYVIVETNSQFSRIVGIPQEEAEGMPASRLFGLGAPPFLDKYSEVALSGRPLRFESFFEPMKKHFEISVAPWGKDGFATIFSDVTERNKAHEALSKNEALYRTLMENIDMGIALIDRNYKVVMVNKALAARFGRDLEYFPNRTCFESMGGCLEVCDHCAGRAAMETGKPVETEFEYIRPGSSSKSWVHLRAIPLKDADGSVSGFIDISLDITEAKRMEAHRLHLEQQLLQAQKMESIGRLAGGIAHDFNNMLTPIMGYSELLLSKSHPGDGMRSKLEQIIKAASRARDLTKQLLTFGRKQTMDMKPIDLNALISSFEKMLRRTIREDIHIKLGLSAQLASIEGDSGQIEQIILNLAVNAQDAMPSGGFLSIETAESELDQAAAKSLDGGFQGPCVVLAVSDTGVGMDTATMERIFEPFFTTKEQGKGTGLGLSTVYGIVKQHSAAIEVCSEPDKGSVFKIYFPKSGKAIHEAQEAGQGEGARSLSGSECILVAEDQDNVRELVSEVLKQRGYKTIVASDGAKALEAAEAFSGKIDLLVSDVVMPGVNGKVLYERLCKSRGRLKVLYMSGYTNNFIGRLDDPGSDADFIQKPFKIENFLLKVRRLLES